MEKNGTTKSEYPAMDVERVCVHGRNAAWPPPRRTCCARRAAASSSSRSLPSPSATSRWVKFYAVRPVACTSNLEPRVAIVLGPAKKCRSLGEHTLRKVQEKALDLDK